MEDWLDAPELHRDLWRNEAVVWTADMDGTRNPDDPDMQWRVGTIAGTGPGRNVFRSRIPAIKASDFGPGGRSHLVAQKTTQGVWVVRNISHSEEARFFHGEQIFWGDNQEDASRRRGGSGPPTMIAPVLRGIAAIVRPTVSSVPASIDDIISKDDVKAFRGHMHMAHADYLKYKKAGLTETTPGSELPKGICRKQCKGGLVLYAKVEIPYYLGEFWESGNIDDAVPAEYLAAAPSIDTAAFTQIFAGLRDRELVRAIGHEGVPSKDRPAGSVSLVSTNHERALCHHKFVDKMYEQEVAAGRMIFFDTEHSPPFFPSTTTPTGATTKKKRTGEV